MWNNHPTAHDVVRIVNALAKHLVGASADARKRSADSLRRARAMGKGHARCVRQYIVWVGYPLRRDER
jgi:hypothetical protein